MPSQITDRGRSDYLGRTLEQTLAQTGPTDWVALCDGVAVQVTGPATSFTGVVERSAHDPADAAAPAPADAAPVSGNPAAGMVANSYAEPGVAWWRVRVTAIGGGAATVAISGGGV